MQTLDGGNSASVIGFLASKTLFFKRHFGASKIALAKARLLKHDVRFHGKLRSADVPP